MFQVWQNQPFSGKMFSSESTVHGCQKFGHIVMKCPEKCAPKAKGGKSKKSWKKRKKKPGGIHRVEETVTVAEPVDNRIRFSGTF